jgi:hypothetical protein
LLFTNNSSASIKERTDSPIASVQYNACAMNILRSSLESRINFIVSSSKGKTEHYQELAWVLALVEEGELILNVISDRLEAMQYLDEFMTIMSNAALSIGDVRGDVEQTLEAAEASLLGLHDAISKVSRRLLPDLTQEIELALPVQVFTLLATGKTNSANVTANEATVSRAAEKKDDVKGERKEHAERMMA